MSALITVEARRDGIDLAVPSARPLLLLLHGYGSHEGDLPSLAAYLPEGFDWVSLRAPVGLPTGGFAWFPITVPGRPSPEPVIEAADTVLAWLDANVHPGTPVVPLGFSQGGLMVTQLLRQAPGRFPAGVVLSGFTLEATLPGDEALAATRTPVFFGHGDADRVISAETTARTSAWLPGHTALTEKVYAGLPHSISAEELADVSRFLTEALV
ncbi:MULTISPECIES: alpha/beta fold hydrolase [unclassified Cryobacterium]|uniref:alpha/beta hydrolase n=1 Tax=unclassified Cryobacterium TaxID=2649013 RepID=UPI002AB437E7|nr:MULTISPECIES: alpha/beta fold hydrolase [unclassified Cryobacterium]MDY7542914.1 alpha/beta fold hydrolase [Cryobacterium sp. 5B3]MEA9999242.1 alpha/beta fold hydrolase [Cryobacterium sp. RTS3]MEB0265373.1 alpha/beta fold hydrolase [Cryobacterium sp. 10I5]MEB0274893.1 alpha/beta fold hydrolase [Cryobacterium sp. 5B3]